MTFTFRSWVLAAGASLAVLAASVSSCTKAKEDPQPTTGAIEGTVSPADALTTVTVTNSGGLAFPATPNATTGAFSFANLVPDTYTLGFAPAAGYVAPAPRTATVAAGRTAPVGTVQVRGDGVPRGTVTWTKDGTAYSSTMLSGLIENQSFSLAAAVATPSFTDRITLGVPRGIQATGTYSLQGTYSFPSNVASYSRTVGAATVLYTTYFVLTSRSTALYGTGALVVSSYDAANGTMSGTFAFDAYNNPNYPVSFNPVLWANITNGTFNLRF